jgi:hypothetical protein
MKDKKQIEELVHMMTRDEIEYFISQVQYHGKVFIPQWYGDDEAVDFGYRNADHMRDVCENVCGDIDDLISDIDIPEDEDED